jgi:hypothetical protein
MPRLFASTVDVASIVTTAFIGVVAFVALLSNRSFQTRDALGRLLEEFNARGFNVLIWRGEQVTRPGQGSWSLDTQDIDELRARLTKSHARGAKGQLQVLNDLTGYDWAGNRVAMDEFQFFVLRLHAWVTSDWFAWRARRLHLLNQAFGYELLSTLLDHRIIALRLRKSGEPDDYYAVQYGLIEQPYRKLVTGLAKRTLARHFLTWRYDLPEPIYEVLDRKRNATEARLADIAPQHTRMTSMLSAT